MSQVSSDSHSLPNKADDELDAYEYRLLGHYTRACAESEDSICHEGTRELAEACQMSTGKVVYARRQLRDKGYITFQMGRGDQPISVSITAERSPHEQRVVEAGDAVQDANESVHPVNDTVHEPPSVHVVNANEPENADNLARAVTSSTESFKHLSTKDKSLKDKKTSTTALVSQIANHPIWKAYSDGYPEIKPRIQAATAATTWNAIQILQGGIDKGEFALEDITETVRWQLGRARRVKYFITYVDADLPDYKAFKAASHENSKPRAAPLAFPSAKPVPQAASTSAGAPNLRSNRG